ncbi:hypothetical protein G7046_g2435 [Stylonectria norvegica]|nr:hypothetical protein G7046_g2435 [Stylonectria norvegica]
MATINPRYYDKVKLIPWNPTDEQHFQRLYDQRVACGWRFDDVGEWKDKMLKGEKFLFWITLADDLPHKSELLVHHVEKYPKESEPLVDTANTIYNTHRSPSNESFFPIGHIALELFPSRNERLGFDPSTIWITSLYVSWALQASGLGRSAMTQIERLAASPPLSKTSITLDTIDGEFQLRETTMKALYEDRGRARPAVMRTTEEWYVRQGYEVVRREAKGFEWVNPVTGEVVPVPEVYLSKSLV